MMISLSGIFRQMLRLMNYVYFTLIYLLQFTAEFIHYIYFSEFITQRKQFTFHIAYIMNQIFLIPEFL